MDRGLAWTIGSVSLAFIALGCALFSWTYFVYVNPNPNVIFASLIAVAGLLFVIAGIASLRYVVVEVTGENRSPSANRLSFFLSGLLRFAILLAVILGPMLELEYFLLTRPPGLLYPDDVNSMIAQLKKVKQPGRVQIIRDEDKRCRALADQLSLIFIEAGWQQVSNPRLPETHDHLWLLNRGLKIYRFNLDRPSLQFVGILYNLDVNYTRVDDYNLYDSDYFIVSISDGWLF